MKVDLYPEMVFSWVCPHCATKNRHNGKAADLSEDDLAELSTILEEAGSSLGDILVTPTKVVCFKCETFFDVNAEPEEPSSNA